MPFAVQSELQGQAIDRIVSELLTPKPVLPIDPKLRRQVFTWEQFLAVNAPAPEPGLCRCGCKKKLEGRRRIWAADECPKSLLERYNILKGDSTAIRRAVYRRDRGNCAGCGCRCRRPDGLGNEFRGREWIWLEEPDFTAPLGQRSGKHLPIWQADHIHPVHQGGGGCGLENYQILCHPCHVRKTNEQSISRGLKRARESAQLALLPDGT